MSRTSFHAAALLAKKGRSSHTFFARRVIAKISGTMLACSLFAPAALWAQLRLAADEPPLELDRMTVIAERPLGLIRREMHDAQNQVFAMFNELNEEDEYDMVCIKEARIGSQIRYRVCRLQFMLTAESEASEDFIMGNFEGDLHVFRAAWGSKTQHHREIMARLANENPRFLELLKTRLALKKEFESKSGKTFPRLTSQ